MFIRELRLASHHLTEQADFYGNTLGFAVDQSESEVSVVIGRSRLIFQAQTAPLAGVYHFAFNIPEQQFDQALEWLQQRVPLLANAHGETRFFSESWNADMVYFTDPAGNIVEFIARHTVPDDEVVVFSAANVRQISEIGIATNDVAEQVTAIQQQIAAPLYLGQRSPTFTAVGDEQGLLIVVQQGRMWYPDQTQPAALLPLTIVTEQGVLQWHG